MSTITIHHKKLRFLFLALVGLLLVVSISFGTISSSAYSITNQKNKVEKSSLTDSQSKQFSFLTDRISNFFNGNDNSQTVKTSNFAAGLSYAALEPSSTFVVNNNGDSNDTILGNGVCLDSSGNCTLRAAIQEANATAGTDEITFNLTTPTTIQLNSAFSPGGLVVSEAVNITGPGARLLTVTGNSNTVSGVFKISYTGTIFTSISGISVINSQGNGINNEARLNLTDVTVKGNGYGIYNSGRLNLNRSAISNNSSGGIYVSSTSIVNISNTTISNNASADHGGGIYSLSSDLTLNNVTISNNTAVTSGGGIYYSGQSPGVYIRNTIIADNTAPAATGPDVYAFNGATGAFFTSRGNNLIGKSGANTGFVHGVNGDKVGTVAVPISPLLGPLQNNGGQTDTRALLGGSPAKDAGNVCVTNSNCSGVNPPAALLLTDQRGNDFPRNYEAGVDIGAFESFYPAPVINSLNPANWGKGKGAFELTINGSNFAVGSVVKWNGQAKPTTFVSNTQLKAQISASDVAANGQFPVTVTNPQPGGGTSEPVNFTVADCSYAINPTSQTVSASGGSFSTTVTAVSGCTWTAVSNDPWITVTTGSSGTGNGTVTFTVASHAGPTRNGTITIGGQTFTVNQLNGCNYSLSSSGENFPGSGGASSFIVITTNGGCAWTAVSNASWITITGGSSGTGSGPVSFSIAANTGGQSRTGTITVAGLTFTITQAGACTFSISPSSQNFIAAGGTGNFSVTTGTGCSWTATPSQTWITINSGATGTGNGTVNFSIAANTGLARNGLITVGGQTFTITQDNGCVYTLSPTSSTVVTGGVTSSFSVSSGAGCTWTAVSNNSWITVTSGASGSGNGTVQYTVAANTGPPRTGTITAGGQTFTINQDTGCTYTLSPTSANIASGGVTSSFTVSSGTGCTWTAVSNASWITVTSGASGTGNGTVQYTVATNTGSERIGTITAAGKTFTVTQAAPCTFSINPSNQNFTAAGGTGNFNVTTATGCGWTATASASWITINSGASGTGSGMVTFSIAANTGGIRNGSISVGGQTFTIVQEASCSYTLSSTSAAIAAGGGSGSVGVTSINGCAWTAVSNAAWITVTGGASGNGNGTVQYTVAANTGPDRTGTITIAGQVFTINQASGCSYVLSPTGATATAAGGTNNFSVVAGAGCTWTAVSNVSWIAVTNGSPGSGNGTVQYTVAANTGVERTGTITVNGQTFTVTQANGCVYSLNPTSQSFSAAAANSSFAVNTNSTCTWTAVSSVTWVTVTNTAGTGNGTVTFTVAANTGLERTGTITVNGQIFNISQASGCTITLSSAGTSFQNSGGTGSFNVTTSNPGCTWSAVTTFPWITINNGTGTGNGTVTFTVAANVSPQRTGTITVGGQTFTITQDNGCAYALSSTSATAPAGGVTAGFNINSGAGCAWTAVSNDSWITINNPSGTGSGTISYTVAANIGPQRTGTITVGGQTFTITQLNGCQYTLSATSATSPIAGGSGSVGVTSISGCAWTAASNAAWITVTSGASGSGNGTVQYTVAANTGPGRSGTITIAGQIFTITQGNGCTYTLSSTSTNINEAGGDRSFNISSGIGCPWTAASNVPWITITSGASGTGNGTIEFSVQANTGPDRIGTITAGGHTFTVNQVTLTVKNLNDSGAGSLRQAVINANNMPGNDVITFQQSLAGTITLTSGEIAIANNGSLEIKGLTADVLFISGNNASRIFYINNATATISGVTLMNGNAVGAGSTENNKIGGAIYVNQGALKLKDVHVTENIITVPNAPGNNGNGGGVYFIGGVNHLIQNSTFSSNRSTFGAGFFCQGCQVTAENSTFSFNTAERMGGGIQNVGDTILRNVTITNNSSDGTAKSGAGIISEAGKLHIGNTIIAGNTGPEITFSVGTFVSLGSNLIGDAPGDSTNTDKPLTYQPSDIRDTSPMFSPLALYGGAIPTEALLVGSPAINAGNNANAPALLQTDQRGSPRVMDGTIDIGAFEYNIVFTPSASTLPNADVGVYYSQTIRAKRFDFTDPLEEFIYRIADGYIPPGMQLSQEGHLYGTPTTAGGYTFTIKAVATNFMAGVHKYTLAIGCSYSINPTSQSINSAGETGTVNLTTQTGCGWTATSNVPWITVTNNTANPRVGNGTVAFAVQPNPGVARTGTITIGGQIFTVNQAAGCAYTLSSSSANVSGSSATGSFSVNSAANCTWTAVSNASWIAITNGSSGTGNATVGFATQVNTGVLRTGTITAAGQTFTVNQQGGADAPRRTQFDFDGDNKTDISIFRPGPGEWWYLKSSNGGNGAVQFGSGTDKLVPADFTGDGKSDFAFYRPSSSEWYVLRSEDFSFYSFPFGTSGDIPAPADYDGDGKADPAVFRPSTTTWYILGSSGGTIIQQFGAAGDVPVVADYDGDSKADIAIYRPSLGQWWLSRSTAGVIAFQFGVSSDKPVQGDYTGDGKADVAFFRPASGEWFILRSEDNSFYAFPFGTNGDIPSPGDYDGDGRADAAVFRPSNNTWFVQRSTSGTMIQGFGQTGDKSVPSAYVP